MQSRTFRAFETYAVVTAIYFAARCCCGACWSLRAVRARRRAALMDFSRLGHPAQSAARGALDDPAVAGWPSFAAWRRRVAGAAGWRSPTAGWRRSRGDGYIEVFQGTPLLMQLFLVFFGLPLLGIDVQPWMAAGLGADACAPAPISPRSGAAASRRCRAGPVGGGGAAWGCSYSRSCASSSCRRRCASRCAPTVGFLVQLVKSTALTSIIGFSELMKTANAINNATFEPFTVYGMVALIYFVLCFPSDVGGGARIGVAVVHGAVREQAQARQGTNWNGAPVPLPSLSSPIFSSGGQVPTGNGSGRL